MIGAFKSRAAIACNRLLDRAGVPFWQRDYYEHIIRDEEELARTRDYILSNPAFRAEEIDTSGAQRC